MSSMFSVTDADTHLSRATGPGCALRRGEAAMSSGSRTAGAKSATATISAIFLIPGCAGSVPAALAVLRAHGDALAVGLHHDHVAVRLLLFSSSAWAGAPGVEVVRPGREVLGQLGELGAADGDAGAGFDDLLGLPEPASGQVEGRQGPHPQRVGVARQDQPGVSGDWGGRASPGRALLAASDPARPI